MPPEKPGPSTALEFASTRTGLLIACLGLLLIGAGLLLVRVDRIVPGRGIVYAAGQHYVYAPREGILIERGIMEGDLFREGDVLFRLETGPLDLEIAAVERELVTLEGQLSLLEVEDLIFAIQPLPAEVATAAARLELLDQIMAIRRDLEASMSGLAEYGAVSSAQLNLQRIAILQTELANLQARIHLEWQTAGLEELETSRRKTVHSNLTAEVGKLRNLRDLLLTQKEAATLRAPFHGFAAEVLTRYPGMKVPAGEMMAKLVPDDPEIRVKLWLAQRNVDLVRPGQFARMQSEVFKTILQDYIEGEVLHVAPAASSSATHTDPERQAPAFAVTVLVRQTPYPLPIGSEVDVKIIIGRVRLIDLFLNQSTLRAPAETEN